MHACTLHAFGLHAFRLHGLPDTHNKQSCTKIVCSGLELRWYKLAQDRLVWGQLVAPIYTPYWDLSNLPGMLWFYP